MNAPLTHPVAGLPEARKIEDGEIVTAPGLIDMSIDWYHDSCCPGPSISSSGLRTIFGQSPAHYWSDSCLNPNRVPPPEKEAFNVGRAAHHLLLGEANFSEHFAIRPDKWDSWRTSAAKEWRDEMIACGITVLNPEHIEIIRGMAESLAGNTLIQAGILNGQIERSLIWQDKESGVWLKARPDAIPIDCADVADLKTARGVDHLDMMKAVAERGYHIQGALIGMAFREVLGIEMSSFSLVFVEKTPPYCCRVVTLKPEDIALGEDQIRASLKIFKRCLETGEWPGPGGVQRDAEYLDLPDWYRNRVKDRLTLIEEEFAA